MGGWESSGRRSAFPGAGRFLKAFGPLGSGISAVVWVPNEGQGRDGIPHPEPREQAAAELPRKRSHRCPCGRGPSGEAPGQGRGEKELPRRATPKGAWLVVSEQQVQVGQRGQEAAPWPALRTVLRITDQPALALQCEVRSLKGCRARKAGCVNPGCQRGESTPPRPPWPGGAPYSGETWQSGRDRGHVPVQLAQGPVTQEGVHL